MLLAGPVVMGRSGHTNHLKHETQGQFTHREGARLLQHDVGGALGNGEARLSCRWGTAVAWTWAARWLGGWDVGQLGWLGRFDECACLLGKPGLVSSGAWQSPEHGGCVVGVVGSLGWVMSGRGWRGEPSPMANAQHGTACSCMCTEEKGGKGAWLVHASAHPPHS